MSARRSRLPLGPTEIGVQHECRTARLRVVLLGRSWDGQTAAGKDLHKSWAEQLLYYVARRRARRSTVATLDTKERELCCRLMPLACQQSWRLRFHEEGVIMRATYFLF